jgi:rare lipoprotein A
MPVATAAAADKPGVRAGADDYRFDMRADGRTMSAAEFDAWMKSRQVRIATGKPGKPAAAERVASPATLPSDASAQASTATPKGDRVYLQIASFAARANADRALALLQGAGIDAATLSDGDAKGHKVWRLRVGPLAATAAPELAARIAGLGFGTPQRVRE